MDNPENIQEVKQEPVNKVPAAVVMEGLLLEDNELIQYEDEEGQVHYLASAPLVKGKKYIVIPLRYDQLPTF